MYFFLTQLTTVMGSSQSTPTHTIVLQTGHMRAKYIDQGVRAFDDASKLPAGVIHRFLPNHLESKYEALDFTNKFGLTGKDSFTIYNDIGHLVSLSYGTPLLENVGVVCSIGTSSTQAFMLTTSGPKPLLPCTEAVRADPAILGNLKTNMYLSEESMARFGSGSGSEQFNTTMAVIQHLRANSVGKNVLFVNAIGYSVMGFNPRNPEGVKQLLVPGDHQKVIKINSPHVKWNTNKNKTKLITLLNKNCDDNMFILARQCDVKLPGGKLEDLSGQWSHEIRELMREPELEIDEPTRHSITRVVDLGGGSGSVYIPTQTQMFGLWSDGKFKKDESVSLMKDNSPNTILASTESEEDIKEAFYNSLSRCLI